MKLLHHKKPTEIIISCENGRITLSGASLDLILPYFGQFATIPEMLDKGPSELSTERANWLRPILESVVDEFMHNFHVEEQITSKNRNRFIKTKYRSKIIFLNYRMSAADCAIWIAISMIELIDKCLASGARVFIDVR